MKHLVRDAKQRVFLIVDNLRVHHAKAVRDWLASTRARSSSSTCRPMRQTQPECVFEQRSEARTNRALNLVTISSPQLPRSSSRSKGGLTGSGLTSTQCLFATRLKNHLFAWDNSNTIRAARPVQQMALHPVNLNIPILWATDRMRCRLGDAPMRR